MNLSKEVEEDINSLARGIYQSYPWSDMDEFYWDQWEIDNIKSAIIEYLWKHLTEKLPDSLDTK